MLSHKELPQRITVKLSISPPCQKKERRVASADSVSECIHATRRTRERSGLRKTHCKGRNCWSAITQEHRAIMKTSLSRVSVSNLPISCTASRFTKRRFNSRRICQRKRHIHQMRPEAQHYDTSWVPPINAETLQELSMQRIFKSIQLRHDLLLDPELRFRPNLDGQTGREKCRYVEHYWRRVEHGFSLIELDRTRLDRYNVLKTLLDQIIEIFASLQSPQFPSKALAYDASFRWPWPKEVTMATVRLMLDTDTLTRELMRGEDGIGARVQFLCSLLAKLCPPAHMAKVDVLQELFSQQAYAKAFRQALTILEIVKLDCANRAIRHYRDYLVDTCPQLEWKSFVKHHSQKDAIATVSEWLEATRKRRGCGTTFIQVYYAGLVYLVTDDPSTQRALRLQPPPFPVVFKFDEHQLTHQLREEFLRIMILALLFLPYRHMAGRNANVDDLRNMKRLFSAHLKPGTRQQSGLCHCAQRIPCYYHLAMHACVTGMKAHGSSTHRLSHHAHFWRNWLVRHLRPSSTMYQLLYWRITGILQSVAQHGTLPTGVSCVNGLEQDIKLLGMKIRAIAHVNLRTYGALYQDIA